MGRMGLSVALLLLGCILVVGGLYMAAGPWWACVALGLMVAVFAAAVLDVGERPARTGR